MPDVVPTIPGRVHSPSIIPETGWDQSPNRDARIYRIFDGTSEIHRTVIARGILKQDATLYDIGVFG